MNKNKCYHCKHAGNTFKIGSLSHLHCHHTKHEPVETAWKTLRVWWDTCEDFEKKVVINGMKVTYKDMTFIISDFQGASTVKDLLKHVASQTHFSLQELENEYLNGNVGFSTYSD